MKYNIEVSKKELGTIITGLATYVDEYQGTSHDIAPFEKLHAKLSKLRAKPKAKVKAKPGPAMPRRHGKSTLAAAQDVSNLTGKSLLEVCTRLGFMEPNAPVTESWDKVMDRLDLQLNQPAEPGEDTSPHIGYICFDCANAMGAQWPEGHCATCHSGVCPECKLKKSLASVDDWDWPKGTKRPKWGAGRD